MEEGDQCDDEVAIKQAAAATVKRMSTKRNKKFKEGKFFHFMSMEKKNYIKASIESRVQSRDKNRHGPHAALQAPECGPRTFFV